MVKSTTGNLKNPRHRRDSITCLCKRLLYTNKSRDSRWRKGRLASLFANGMRNGNRQTRLGRKFFAGLDRKKIYFFFRILRNKRKLVI